MPSVGTAESSMWVNYKPGKPVIIQGYQTRAQVKVRIVHPVDFLTKLELVMQLYLSFR